MTKINLAVLARTLALALALALAAAAPAAAASPQRLIVGFKPGTSEAQRQAALAGRGRLVRRLATGRAVLVEPRGGYARAVASIATAGPVLYVESDYPLHAERAPNDPQFANQWHLENRGQTGGTADADIDATDAWDRFIGGAVTVAVADTGADLKHPDLAPNLWVNPGEVPGNGVDDERDGIVDDVNGADFLTEAHSPANCEGAAAPKQRDGDPDDQSGHGTHVAGIVAAAGDNGQGVSGVSWSGVKLMVLKFLDGCGAGNTSDAVDAIAYARAHGARIVNASFGGPDRSEALEDAIRGDDFLFATAAGNGGTDAIGDNIDLPGTPLTPDLDEYPAESNLANILTVAATTDDDSLAGYSNFGPTQVDVAAPGSSILSTLPGGKYGLQSGTSMAAGVASGAAGLVAAGNPGMSVAALRSALIDRADIVPALVARVNAGHRLNVNGSLGNPASPNSSPAPPTTQTVAPAAARPSRFALLAPPNRSRRRSARVSFRWKRSTSFSGIREYRLYLNGRRRKLLKDPDGPQGRRAPPRTATLRLAAGRTYRWYVKAYDYDGGRARSPSGGRAFRFAIARRSRR